MQLISYVIVGALVSTLVALLFIISCHLIRIKRDQIKFEKNQQNDSNEFSEPTTNCCNNMPFEGSYGIINSYLPSSKLNQNQQQQVVQTINTASEKKEKAANENELPGDEFNLLKSAFFFLNSSKKLTKAKSLLNNFQKKQPEAQPKAHIDIVEIASSHNDGQISTIHVS